MIRTLILLSTIGCIGFWAPSLAAQEPAAPTSEDEAKSVRSMLDEAVALEAELEYEQAVGLYLEVIADERASDEELVEANMHAGIVQRILDNDVDARLHFNYVLTRDATAQLPPGMPPKITTFFELIRKEVLENPGVAVKGGSPALFWTGVSVAGVGGLAMAGFATLATVAELTYNNPDLSTEERRAAQDIAPLYWGGVGVGAVLTAVGIGLLIAGSE